jgi:hypothetical protein
MRKGDDGATAGSLVIKNKQRATATARAGGRGPREKNRMISLMGTGTGANLKDPNSEAARLTHVQGKSEMRT